MTTRGARRTSGIVLALASACFYATKSVLVRFGLEAGAQALALLAYRMVFTGLMFVAAELVLFRTLGRPWGLFRDPKVLFAGVLLGLSAAASFLAVDRIGVSLTVILIYTHPAFVALYDRVLWREPLGGGRATALGVAYVGCLLAVSPWSGAHAAPGPSWGFALALFAGASYAGYQMLVQELTATTPSLRVAAATIYVSLPVVMGLWRFEPVRIPSAAIGVAAAMAVFSTFLPLLLLTLAIRRVGASTASATSLASPFASLLMARAFFAEVLTPVQWVGGLLVVGAVAGIGHAARRARPEPVVIRHG